MHKQYVYLSPIRAQMIYFNYMHNLLNKKMIFYKKKLINKMKNMILYYLTLTLQYTTKQSKPCNCASHTCLPPCMTCPPCYHDTCI